MGINRELGHRIWAIAEGYLPEWSNGVEPQMKSHETLCILNTADTDAHIKLWIYFSDREPLGPYQITVSPQRTLHQRFNNLNDPQPIPEGTDYACVVQSDIPVVVQHSRLDSRQAENALFSTIAFHSD